MISLTSTTCSPHRVSRLARLALVLTAAVLSVLQTRDAAATGGYDYGNYKGASKEEYGGDIEDYGATEEEWSALCYVCEYSIVAEHDYHVEGLHNCNDPFRDVDVPVTRCILSDSGFCSKKFRRTGNGSYEIHRGCTKNCKQRSDENSYTKCCQTDYCNSYSSSYTMQDHRWPFLLSCVLSVIIAQFVY